MPPPSTTAVLQGDALHAFLDQAQELLDSDVHRSTAIDRQDRLAAALELMEQQRFTPASASELERLHDFWLVLEQPQTANALLQTHRHAVLQAHQGLYRDTAAVCLALSDIQSRLLFDPHSAVALLLPAAAQIGALPDTPDVPSYWDGWHHLAQAAQAWDLAEQGVDLRRTHEKAYFDNEGDHAFGDAIAWMHKAMIARLRDEGASITPQVQAAIDTLRHAGDDQLVDFDRWMHLAERMLPLAPQSLPSLLMACEQQLARTENPPCSPAVRAHRKVRIARLQARACHQSGQVQAALQLAPQGHFSLTDDAGDPFTALRLQWMVQAEQWAQAAALALDSVLHARPGATEVGYQIALEQIDRDPEHATPWALILACAQIDPHAQRLVAELAPPPLSADQYLERARRRDPHHPAIALLEGMRYARQRQLDKALPLLEQSVGQHPALADGEKLFALWSARFAVLPLEAALARPFPEVDGAHGCYAIGVALNDGDDLEPFFGDLAQLPAYAVREPLAQRYYEAGLQRFEQFWATQQGAFQDADLHVYSMLCNNLAIKYRRQGRYDEAAHLHRCGLGSSPFAEHHDGLLWCAIRSQDDAGIVTEAEQLWHFAREYGYSRHTPAADFPSVGLSLYTLGRTAEISIWLERLDEWYGTLDEDEQATQRRAYLAALMSLLDFSSDAHPELVLPRLRAHLDEVRALRECYTLRRLACAMEAYPEHLEEALALHHEAVALLGPKDNEEEQHMAHGGIARTERKLASARQDQAHRQRKPWWKLW